MYLNAGSSFEQEKMARHILPIMKSCLINAEREVNVQEVTSCLDGYLSSPSTSCFTAEECLYLAEKISDVWQSVQIGTML